MTFSINVYDIPYFRDYQAVKKRYDSIKPIRGSANVRPMGDRRKKHIRLEEAARNLQGAAGIACVLYHTEVVTFYEDGTVRLNMGGWPTQSTKLFMHRVFYPLFEVFFVGGEFGARTSHGTFKSVGGEMWLNTLGEPINVQPFAVHTINRKAMKRVREKYKPFIDYLHGRGRLTHYAKPEGARVLRPCDVTAYMTSSEVEDWDKVYQHIIFCVGNYKSFWDSGHWEQQWVCPESSVDAYVRRLLLSDHADQVLDKEVLPLGIYRKDPNAKYAR